jgi:hypothetical protein
MKKVLLILSFLIVSSVTGSFVSSASNTFEVKIEIQNWSKKVQKVLFGYSGYDQPTNLPALAMINAKGQGQFYLPNTIPDSLLNNPISSANLYDGLYSTTDCSLDSKKAEASLVHVYFIEDNGLYFDGKTNKIFSLSPGSNAAKQGFSQKHVLFYASKAFSANIERIKCQRTEVNVNLNIKKGWNILRSIYTFGTLKDKAFISMDNKIIRDYANSVERWDSKSEYFQKAYERYLK